jgi:Transposase DDE domain
MKDNPFKSLQTSEKGALHMKHDTPWTQEMPVAKPNQEGVKAMVKQFSMVQPLTQTGKKRGRPQSLLMEHLAISILWCFLHGWHSQLELWRFLCRESIGHFDALSICDQAVYKRLANGGAQAMQVLCAQMSAWMLHLLAPYEDRDLAPGFGQILALDESTLDAMKRWISELRGLPNGDPLLLAGRMSVLFDVRRQCVRRLDLLPEANVHSFVHARAMIDKLQRGTLLLFDLGYYAFAWFDELTARGIWWISRVKSNSSFKMQHVLIDRDGYREEIVQLGAYRSDHAAFSARLISIRYHGVWYRYLTNVLDPRALSGAEVARLYGRRWDIELAFRTLKDHLNLRVLWSAKSDVIAVQVWATLILAQLCSCYQVQVAAEAGVEVFDVSLELLLRELPRLLSKGIDPVKELARIGRKLGIIRPSTRKIREVPLYDVRAYCWPPSDLPLFRVPRYDHRPAGNRNRQKKTVA